MADKSTYMTRSFSSFSGSDIRAVFAGVDIGTLQAISYAIQREKAPIYVLGDPNPRAFSRGKRGIAGSMIFVMFDDHALLSIFQEYRPEIMNFVKDKQELDPVMAQQDEVLARPDGNDSTPDSQANIFDDYEVTQAFYVDQIPPFDVAIVAVNEVAAGATMYIWGAEILNEGYGISVDDMVSEMQTTYVARGITRWTRASRGASPSFPFKAERVANGTKITG